MNSIVQETTDALKGKKTLDVIAKQTSGNTKKAKEVIDSLVPRLFEGFSDKATKPGGSAVVTEVLEEQDQEILDDLAGYFEKGDNKAGARIMRKVLPGKTTELVDSFAADTGLSKSSFKRLIPLIMPVVASVTAKQVESNKITGEDLGTFLVDQDGQAEVSDETDAYEAIKPTTTRRPFLDDDEEEESDPSWLWWVIAGLISLAAVALILGELTSDDDDEVAGTETEEVTEEPVTEDDETVAGEGGDSIDPELTEAAATAIADLGLTDAGIEVVATSSGLAAVAGIVSTQEEADLVVEAISGVEGIDSVFNELMIVDGGVAEPAETEGEEVEPEGTEAEVTEGEAEEEVAEETPATPAATVDAGSLNAALNIGPFQFEENSSVLTAASQALLTDEVIPFLAENTEQAFEVQGHTNNIGQARDDGERNRELSLLRAEVVRDFLIDAGADEARLSAAGFGPDQPLVPHEEADAPVLNRRVVLVPAN